MNPTMLGSSHEDLPPEAQRPPYMVDRLAEGADPIRVGFPVSASKACGLGHPKKGKGDCKECHRLARLRNRPLKSRPCKACGSVFSGSKRSVCPDCAEKRDADDRKAELAASHRSVRTRTCTDCKEARPLDEFLRPNLRTQGERKGTKQYFDTCAVCRSDAVTEDDGEGPDDSPYEVARLQVERIFGLPSRQWLNVRGHPLDLLHYSRMLAIHNTRAKVAGLPLLRADRMVPTRSLWSFIVQAQLTKRLRTPAAVLPLIAKAA